MHLFVAKGAVELGRRVNSMPESGATHRCRRRKAMTAVSAAEVLVWEMHAALGRSTRRVINVRVLRSRRLEARTRWAMLQSRSARSQHSARSSGLAVRRSLPRRGRRTVGVGFVTISAAFALGATDPRRWSSSAYGTPDGHVARRGRSAGRDSLGSGTSSSDPASST